MRRRWTPLWCGLAALFASTATLAQAAYCLQVDTDRRQVVDVRAGSVTPVKAQNSQAVEALLNDSDSRPVYAISPDLLRVAYLGQPDHKLDVLKVETPIIAPAHSPDYAVLTFANSLQWSHDGRWIAYHWQSPDKTQRFLSLSDADGHEAAVVSLDARSSEEPFFGTFAAFSPDDSYLAVFFYDHDRAHAGTRLSFFHIPDLAGVDLPIGGFALAGCIRSDMDPKPDCALWGQSGHRAVLVLNRAGFEHDDLLMLTVGGDDRRLFPLAHEQVNIPVISPDGKRAALRSFAHDVAPDVNGRIDIFSADGTQIHDVGQIAARQLVYWTPYPTFQHMVWSADSQSLVYWLPPNKDGSVNAELRVFNTATQADHPLLRLGYYDVIYFTLAPTGSRLAFATYNNNDYSQTVSGILALDTNSVALFLESPLPWDDFVWSPDGERLAFVRSTDDYVTKNDVHIVDQKGKALMRFRAAGKEVVRLWWTACSK